MVKNILEEIFKNPDARAAYIKSQINLSQIKEEIRSNPKKFEDYVAYTYQILLNIIERKNVTVEKNFKKEGRSGVKHEFDVYYEYELGSIKHQVAIECKAHGRPIEKGKIFEFSGKMNDFPNMIGVMVSKAGFQKGAKESALHLGIQLLTIDEIPQFNELAGTLIKEKGLPSSDIVGEPFWSLMEFKDGEITGTYKCYPTKEENKFGIPLFFSKALADASAEKLNKNGKCCVVRGLNQPQLKFLLDALEITKQNTSFLVSGRPFLPDGNFMELDASYIRSNYLLLDS